MAEAGADIRSTILRLHRVAEAAVEVFRDASMTIPPPSAQEVAAALDAALFQAGYYPALVQWETCFQGLTATDDGEVA